MSNTIVQMYTDGACRGNPGVGGWGVVRLSGNQCTEFKGAQPMTTNNRMELVAAIRGLESLEQDARVQVYTDSQYVRNGILEWMKSWKSNGWRTAAGKPVKNRDLWLALDEASGYCQVEWRWVRGHAGNSGNERADALANTAIDEYLASVAGRQR